MRVRMKEATHYNERNNKIKAFSGWRNFCREVKREKDLERYEQRVELEVRDIAVKYQKEIEQLQAQLNEAARKNEEY
jgi:hypothetical protein